MHCGRNLKHLAEFVRVDVDVEVGGWERGCQEFAHPANYSPENHNIVAQGASGRFDTPDTI